MAIRAATPSRRSCSPACCRTPNITARSPFSPRNSPRGLQLDPGGTVAPGPALPEHDLACRPRGSRSTRRRWRRKLVDAIARRARAGSSSPSGTASAASPSATATRSSCRSKSGKPLGALFPRDRRGAAGAAASAASCSTASWCCPIGETLSFAALQMRLHPAASRIAQARRARPRRSCMLFDCLQLGGERSCRSSRWPSGAPRWRRSCAEAAGPRLLLSPCTARPRRWPRRWFARTGGALDGIVAKRLDEPYRPGERAMLKVKRQRTADCVVGGYPLRRGQQDGRLAAARALRRRRQAQLTSASPRRSRPPSAAELTAKLEPLHGPPGFTGNAPGGPSRWSTRAQHRMGAAAARAGRRGASTTRSPAERFRHGTTFLRWRPDKAPRAMHDGAARARAAPGGAGGVSGAGGLARQLDQLDLVPLRALEHRDATPPASNTPVTFSASHDQRAVVARLDVVADQPDRAVARADADIAPVLVLRPASGSAPRPGPAARGCARRTRARRRGRSPAKPNAPRQKASAGSMSGTLSLKKPRLVMRLGGALMRRAVCGSARGFAILAALAPKRAP